jgi:rhodanese-related sulfurtransferase
LPEDFDAGHIHRAINIPYDNLDDHWNAFIDSLDKNREYVIYCSGGECEASLSLARIMKKRGYQKLSVFFGGWQEWLDNKLPVTYGSKRPAQET